MRGLLFLAAAGLAGAIPIAVQAQEQRNFDAPGFADFLAVDGKFVWATNRGRVERWSKKGKVAEVPMTKPCGAMAVVGPAMWVADCAEGTINRIDTKTGKITATVATGIANLKGELAVVSGGGSIWVASDAKGVISRVDPVTHRVIATIAVDPDTYYLAYAFGSLWAVSDSHQTIQRIDPATNMIVKRTALGLQSSFLAASADTIWVVEQGDGTVARVDAVSGDVTGRVKVGETLKFADIDTGGGKVWVRTRIDQVFVVIDPKSATILMRVGKPQAGGGLRYSPAGLWTTQHDMHILSWWPRSPKIGY